MGFVFSLDVALPHGDAKVGLGEGPQPYAEPQLQLLDAMWGHLDITHGPSNPSANLANSHQ